MLRRKKYLFPVIFVFVFCSVNLVYGLLKFPSFGQRNASPVTVSAGSFDPEAPESAAAAERRAPGRKITVSTAAASENVRLRDTLAWTFGGKAQRGWYLYDLLIQQTIGTDAGTDTAEFAQAVADWQRKSGLKPTGVVDKDTLAAFIKGWQSRRLNSSRYPLDEQLVLAPASNFYDRSRSEELRRVEREAFTAYKRMIAAATAELKLKTGADGELAADESFLKIVSAFRSREYQNRLRAASPNSGRAALAVNSPHFTGNALDIYVGGEPVSTRDENRAIQVQTPAYKWMVKNASRFGFYPYFYEPWHWEYVPSRLSL